MDRRGRLGSLYARAYKQRRTQDSPGNGTVTAAGMVKAIHGEEKEAI
jgi:hypothetical protein